METGFISKPWENKDTKMSAHALGWGTWQGWAFFVWMEDLGLKSWWGWHRGRIWEAKHSGNRPAAQGSGSQLTPEGWCSCHDAADCLHHEPKAHGGAATSSGDGWEVPLQTSMGGSQGEGSPAPVLHWWDKAVLW